jgi:AcrR family transcriptional regulator
MIMHNLKAETTYRQSLRERILDVAFTKFIHLGIRAVKMDDIARELTISKRTLYEIYENKAILLFEGVKRYKKLRDEELNKRARESDSVIAFILDLYRRETEIFHIVNPMFYSDLEKYPQVMKFLETNRKEHRLLFLEIMNRGVEEGYFRSDVNYELVVKLFDSISKYMSGTELYQYYSFEELFCNMVFVTIRGFCTIKGIEELDKNLH